MKKHKYELHSVFPSADIIGDLRVFNIGGNKYRLITFSCKH
ncbi:type II toxin-antitoxin system HigB family toxin [Dolichospermum sp. UHCC 0259]